MPGGEPLGSESDNALDYAEAVRVVLGELPDLPHLPELPGRGAAATMTGRGLAADRRARRRPPAGRLAAHRRPGDRPPPGPVACSPRTSTRSRSRRRAATGPFKVQVAGPWTLAATVEKPRGDKVLADHGARRDLAQALAEGLRDHVADLRRRLPGADRLRGAGRRAGAAGRARRGRSRPRPASAGTARSHPPEASEALEWVLAAITEAGAEPWVHSLRARRSRSALVRGAGRAGLSRRPRPCSRPADLRRAGGGARGGGDGRCSGSCRPPTRRTEPDAPPGHRAGAALARHARPRARGGLRAAGGHPVLRAGRRVARLGAQALHLRRRRRHLWPVAAVDAGGDAIADSRHRGRGRGRARRSAVEATSFQRSAPVSM